MTVEYWLASAAELKRLVPYKPELRVVDHEQVRWLLVAETAAAIVRRARKQVGEVRTPADARTWNISVRLETNAPLRAEEAPIVASLFSWESAVGDFGVKQLTNGRHRIYNAWSAGAPFLPIRSAAVSGWTDSMYGDPSCTTLDCQVWECAYLHRFAGASSTPRATPDSDSDFIDALDCVIEVADEFLSEVAADAFRADPSPRHMTPIDVSAEPTVQAAKARFPKLLLGLS